MIRILGPVDHHRTGGPIAAHGKTAAGKAVALLAALVVNANRPVTLDSLTEALWAGEPPRSAVAYLQIYVNTLRDTFGVTIESQGGGFLLTGESDYLRFKELVAQANPAAASSPLETLRLLERALKLWRGESAAQGVPRHGPLAGWLGAVDEERMRAIECLAETRIALGEARLAERELSVLLTRSPLRDRAWCLRMCAHHKLGEYGAMAASYQAAARHFRAEHGTAPSAQLTDLYRSLVLGG